MNIIAALAFPLVVVTIEYIIVKHPPLIYKSLVILAGLLGGAVASVTIPPGETARGVFLMVFWSLCRVVVYAVNYGIEKYRVREATKTAYDSTNRDGNGSQGNSRPYRGNSRRGRERIT